MSILNGVGAALSSGNGILLSGDSFTVTLTGNKSADDVVILAAFPGTNPINSSIDGVPFTPTTMFGETSAAGALVADWQAMGLCASTCPFTPTYGFVDLQTGPGGTVTESSPFGTIFYAMASNDPQHNTDIFYMTPNSEIVAAGTSQVSEPSSLILLGTGVLGLASGLRGRFL